MPEPLIARVARALDERVFPGCVIGVVEREGGRRAQPFGRLTYEPDAPPVTNDVLYDLASVTKSVPTAALAHQLLAEGRIALDDPLAAYVPEYRTRHAGAVTLWHLLTYTLGNRLPLSFLSDLAPDEIFEAICIEESGPPGVRFSYSNTPALLLGVVIERVLGMPLDEAARERVFAPLGMRHTTFRPSGAAPTEAGVRDVPHDESTRVFARQGRAVGHAGLFSNAPDLLAYAQSILAGDTGPMTRNLLAHLGASAALGWELEQPWMGQMRSGRFGKTGFTGTSIVCDQKRGMALVILSNRIYPRRPKDGAAITAFRADVCDILLG